jgi:hypothetical protein
MDFLEGFLMGPHWSDTEYESRHHIGFYLLTGLIIAGCFGYLLVQPEQAERWVWPWPVLGLLLFLLMLLNPFLCNRYYRQNRLIRLLILLVLMIKNLLAILLLFALALPMVHLDLTNIADNLLNLTNESIAAMTDRFSALNNASAMIFGIIAGSLLMLLRAELVLAIGTLVPCLTLLIVRWLQKGIDWIIRKKLIPQMDKE